MTVAEWKTGRGRDALFCEGDEQCSPNRELPGCGLDWWKNNFADCSLQPTHALGNNPTCASIVFSLLLNGVKMWVEVHSIKEKNWEISQKSSTAACLSLSIEETHKQQLCIETSLWNAVSNAQLQISCAQCSALVREVDLCQAEMIHVKSTLYDGCIRHNTQP